eukprot:5254125-Pyramimonas_sp.AAC.1
MGHPATASLVPGGDAVGSMGIVSSGPRGHAVGGVATGAPPVRGAAPWGRIFRSILSNPLAGQEG